MSPFKGKFQKPTTEFLEVGRRALPLKRYRIIRTLDKRVIIHVGLSRDGEGELRTDVRTLLVPDTIPQHVEWVYRIARAGLGPVLAPGWATITATDNNNNESNDHNSICSVVPPLRNNAAPTIEYFDYIAERRAAQPTTSPSPKNASVQTNSSSDPPVSQ